MRVNRVVRGRKLPSGSCRVEWATILALVLAACPCGQVAADPRPDVHLEAVPDPQQIEEGEPVTLQDDITNDPGELSLQYSGAYARSQEASAKEVLEQGLTLKLGLIEDFQVSIDPDYDTGRAEGRDSGGLQGDVLVHLKDQTRLFPAVAFDLFYSTPYGAGHKSAAYIFRAIASHSVGAGDSAPRLHLNLSDFHLAQPEGGDRKNRLQVVFGGSFLPTPMGAVVADFVYGASDVGRGKQAFLEIGYTRVLPHAWTCELGVGRQVAGPGNAFHIFFSVEKEIHVF